MSFDLEYFFDLFICIKKSECRLSKNTIEAYTSDLILFIEFFKKNQIDCILENFFIFLSEKYAASSIRRKMTVASQFISFLKTEDVLVGNFDLPKIKLPNQYSPFFSSEDFEKMRSVFTDSPQDTRLRAFIEFLYSTGCRISEALSIKMPINEALDSGVLEISGKGQKKRHVFFNDQCVFWLKKYIEIRSNFGSSNFLWTSRQSVLSRQRVFQMLKDLAIKSEVDASVVFPHAFRHRILTDLVKNGANLMAVQSIAGHRKIDTTARYTHIEDYLYEDIEKHHSLILVEN
jgi:integrase/recombinase XerD